jgi:hypothetical protein
MGLARELSQPKRRRAPAPARAAALDVTALRRLTRAARPDMETFAAVLARTSTASSTQEWQAAHARFTALGGSPVGG